MKVNIGPFKNDLVPIRRWEQKYEWFRSDTYYHEKEDWKWFDKVIYKIFDGLNWLFLPVNRWSNARERKVKIHIDNYDVWSADHTLAMIIHPTLIKLKEVQHGACHVSLDDVPESMRPTEVASNDNGYVDNTHFDRWNYVLDEMIWAFEQCSKGDKGEDQFFHNIGQLKMITAPLEDNPKFCSVDFDYQKDPTKPKYWVDYEGKKAHNERISNGLRLFAKYYFSLWD